MIYYDQIEELAKVHKPKLIIAGGLAIPRTIDFAKIRSIADSVGAYVLADVAHFAGLIAAANILRLFLIATLQLQRHIKRSRAKGRYDPYK